MVDLVQFFDAIHPPGGWRCLFTLPNRQHYWFQSSIDMARVALHLDKQGLAVFYACATFTRKERKQGYVHKIGGFWYDIDAGLAKAYASPGEAYGALEAYRGAAALPPATLCISGGGLHAYWTLRDPLGASEWLDAAHRLRALAVRYGLKIDPSSTIDSARILRPPGTANRKLLDAAGRKLADVGGPERLVIGGPLKGPYTRDELAPLFGKEVIRAQDIIFAAYKKPASKQSAPRPHKTPPPANLAALGPAPAFLQNQGKDRDALNVRATEPDPDVGALADRCAQMSRLRGTQGVIPEPEWYAALGVLAYCGVPGRQAAHEWSSGDPRYRAVDTDAKLDQYAANAAGPTTCVRFTELNPLGCAGCQYAGKITTPKQLGYPMSAAAIAPAPLAVELPYLPPPFMWVRQRLCVTRKPTDDDPTTHHVISVYPIVVDELAEGEKTRKISAVFRSWEPMAAAWRDFSISLGDVVGTGGKGKIADHGVAIPEPRWRDFQRFINAMMTHHRGTKRYGVRYEQFGWKETPDGPGFVIGNQLYLASGSTAAIHGNEEVMRRGALMEATGDLKAWSAAANALLAPSGMEAHRFMALCSFAAPLYHFTGEPGAPCVHGASRGSGNAKTTVLEIIQSAWGARDATSIVERDTAVAKFITLGTLANLPVCFDEMRFATPEEAKHYVLQTTLGRDKQRGTIDGHLRSDPLGWSTIHISASNLSLVDMVRSDGAEVAQAARIFEFTMVLPTGLKTTQGDELRRTIKANKGVAGRAFIQHVLRHYAAVRDEVRAQMRNLEEQMTAGPDERFVLRTFACVAVAARIVRETGILALDDAGVMRWALEQQKGNAGRLQADSIMDGGAVVGRLLNEWYGQNTLVMPSAVVEGRPNSTVHPLLSPRSELHVRIDKDTRRVLVDIVAVRKWMQEKNYSFTEILKELKGLGVMLDDRVRRTLGAGTEHAVGQTWCWLLDGNHPLLATLVDLDIQPGGNVVVMRGAR